MRELSSYNSLRSVFKIVFLIVSLALWVEISPVKAQDNPNANSVIVQSNNSANPSQTNPGWAGDNPTSDHVLPNILDSWKDWATWDDVYRDCPRPYNDANHPIPLWPSQLNLQVTSTGAVFQFSVEVRRRFWIALPGDERIWPEHVLVNGKPVPVLSRDSTPAVQLDAGKFLISGSFSWAELPPRFQLPGEIGILALMVEGKPIANPTWGSDGFLIFQQPAPPPSERDFMEVKVFRLLEDGLPLNLETQVVLKVSGHSREENLGGLLPAGWKLSGVDTTLPCSIDDNGNAKVQVRPGTWSVTLHAYTLDPKAAIGYAAGIHPAVDEELVGFRSQPSFRIARVTDLPSIDVTQTDFPDLWGNRSFPVYRWKTDQLFHLEETMRGMGQKNHEGLTVSRQLWLDDEGNNLVYHDTVTARAQELWRLDAALDHELGAVQEQASDGLPETGLLITKNPTSPASGVELRRPNISLIATGMVHHPSSFSASGWNADADSLTESLELPPGWRLIALFGADWVNGAWLTTWSLEDLFLLLIFSLAIGRVWGWPTGLVAFFGYALAYQEPDAPRILWLCLLPPLVLLKLVKTGAGRCWLQVWKWIILIPFLIASLVFIQEQVVGALYPQMENPSPYQTFDLSDLIPGQHVTSVFSAINCQLEVAQMPNSPAPEPSVLAQASITRTYMPKFAEKNLAQDEKAKVQTGPAVPIRSWRTIQFGWSGPVTPDEQVHLILIPPIIQILLNLIRIALLIALAVLLLGAQKLYSITFHADNIKRVVIAVGIAFLFLPAFGQTPTDEQISQLRERLLRTSTAFPNAAEISSASLSIRDGVLNTSMEVHAALETAVPLPGKIPSWSPVSVKLDGHPEVSLTRLDGYLWILVPAGIHQVEFQGMIPTASDWSWTYQLKPHHIAIEAPEWTWTGVLPDSTLGDQVFFSRKVAKTTESDYGRQQLSTLVQLERHIEFGQVWQIRNTIQRVTSNSGATSIRLPLLPNEKVLSAYFTAHDGYLEVPLAADQDSVSWDSELPKVNSLILSTHTDDTWVELWTLSVSPVWDVTSKGIEPTFNAGDSTLTPTWRPWPGESVELEISRPQAISGNTLTLNSVTYTGTPGLREMDCNLSVGLKCSVGQELYIEMPKGVSVNSLMLDGAPYPVNFDTKVKIPDDLVRLAIPLSPDSIAVELSWKMNRPLALVSDLPKVTFYHSDDKDISQVGCANNSLSLTVPSSRFVLWTWGPMQGPAVMLWAVLAFALLASYILNRVPLSPIGWASWFLLAIGLSQVSFALLVFPLAWFFLFSWRGRESYAQNSFFKRFPFIHNVFQVGLILLTLIFISTALAMVNRGLLGQPCMWIQGNDSYDSSLNWYKATSAETPSAGFISMSLWWYRLAMLLWSLWLAQAMLKWLTWGYKQMVRDGFWRPLTSKKPLPPLPTSSEKTS